MDDYFKEDLKIEEPEIEFTITDEFQQTFDLIENSKFHIFLTGDAGTGKSTFLRWFLKTTKKNCATIAPTGIAAVNVRGQTMHSFFKWPPRPMTSADIKVLDDVDVFNAINCLIIDEISMVRVDQMDFIDEFLRMNRGKDVPFGGVQLIMIGDLLQLPPVTSDDMVGLGLIERYGCEYFFAADVWKETELKHVKFTKIFRQQDPVFIEILNKIRKSSISYDEIDKLNAHRFTKEDEEKSAYLCSRNDAVDKINKDRIDKLPGELRSYDMIRYGKTANLAAYIPEVLSIKKGAKIMMLVNDSLGRWQNGTIGYVVQYGDHSVLIKIYGVDYWITRHKWDSVKHKLGGDGKINTETDGYVEQFPFKVAFAISVHKSQGQTFDSVIIDLGTKAFASGIAYVAISRCKSLNGVFFSTPLRMNDIWFDGKVLKFLQDGKYTK